MLTDILNNVRNNGGIFIMQSSSTQINALKNRLASKM